MQARRAGLLHGDQRTTRHPPAVERFWSKVDKTDTCWLWTAGTGAGGYGKFSPTRSETVLAHRYSYELLVGPIPEGATLDHLCRVRHCVNPAHLEPVTQRVNILRGEGLAAKNAAKTHCDNGHEFSAENTYVTPEGWRQCRICNRAKVARYENRTKQDL